MTESTPSATVEDPVYQLFDRVQAAADPRQELARVIDEFPEFADRLRRMVHLVEMLDAAPSMAPTGPWDYGSQPVPQEIGEYAIEAEIARGGMGVIYKGRHRRLDRVVAIKTLQNPAASGRFATEQKYLARFHENSIVALHEAGHWEGQPYMVMPFIDGAPLHRVVRVGRACGRSSSSSASSVASLAAISHDASLLEDESPAVDQEWPEYPKLGSDYYRSVARCLAALARGVQAIHDKQLVHRDLKPQNVMVDGSGRAWIIDLGVACELEPATEAADGQLVEGDLAGTIAYMAPEQFDGRFGKASDIWGLGLILYELLTFQHAYRVPLDAAAPSDRSQAKTAELFLQHAEARHVAVDPSDVSRRIPADLSAICRKCLRPDPGQRYKSAEQLAADLDRWSKHEPVTARRIALPTRLWKWSRRRPGRAVFLAGLLLAVLAAGVALSIHNRRLSGALTETAQREATVSRQQASSRIAQGYEAWRDSNINEAIVHLHHDYRLADGTDLRGWEWYHLNGLCQTHVHEFHHETAVTAVVFGADSSSVMSADALGTIRVWPIGATEPQRVVPAHPGRIGRLLLSPDGTSIASAGIDAQVRIWSLPHWTSRHELKAHGTGVGALAFTPDSQRLATGGADGLVFIWDLETGEIIETLEQHEHVHVLDFSPDGSRLAVGVTGQVRVFETRSWRKTADAPVKGAPRSVRFEPDGNGLLIAGQEAKVLRVDFQNRRLDAFTETDGDRVNDIGFSPDGRAVFLARDDGSITEHSRRTGLQQWTIRGHRLRYSTRSRRVESIHQLDVSRDGRYLATAGEDGTVKLWDVKNSPEVAVLRGHDVTVFALDINPEGNRVVSGSFDNTVRVWDWRTGETVVQFGKTEVTRDERDLPLRSTTIDGHTNIVTDAAFSPDGRFVASASFDETVRVWSLESRTEERRLRHPRGVIALAFDPEVNQLATACWDDILRVWDLDAGRIVCQLEGHTANPRKLRYVGPSRLASCGDDGTVRIWDTAADKELRSWVAHAAQVNALAVDPRRGWIASGGDDRVVRVWEIESGRLVMRLAGQNDSIRGLAFHPHEPRLASVSIGRPGMVIWNLVTQQVVARFEGSGDVLFSPDGWRLATAGRGNAILVWDAEYGQRQPLLAKPAELPAAALTAEASAPAQGLRVLGYRYAEEVVNGVKSGKTHPAPDGTRLLLVALSMPASWLTPSGVEYAKLQAEAGKNDEWLPGPRDRIRYEQPELFWLVWPDGTERQAVLIDDWPDPDGFHFGSTGRASLQTRPDSRICLAVAWEVPKGVPEGLPAVRVRRFDPVPITDRQLDFGDAVVK